MQAFTTNKFYSPVLASSVDKTNTSSNVYVQLHAKDRTHAVSMLSAAGLSYMTAVAIMEEAREFLTTAFIPSMNIIPID